MIDDIDSLPLGWISSATDDVLMELDREIIQREGYRGFIKLAWPIVEGGKEFVSSWHIDAIADHIQGVLDGHIRRLLINIPPRCSKSTTVSVMLPAYDWSIKPQRQYLYASYAHALSIRDNRKCRMIVESKWYQNLFGDRFKIVSDQNTKIRYDNDKGGYRIATSFEGQVTGEGGDIVVIDDPNNVKETESETIRDTINTTWDDSFQTRLNNPKTGSFIVMQQRTHEKDLTGHILGKEGDDWTKLILPMRYERDHPYVFLKDPRTRDGELLCPDRWGEEEVKRLERNQYLAAGQLQQRPAPREGGLFKKHWFPIIDTLPPIARWMRGWDMAATEEGMAADPDYTAGVKIGVAEDGRIIIADVTRFRKSPLGVEEALKNTASQDGKQTTISIPQDPGAAGKAVTLRYVQLLSGYIVKTSPESGSKIDRAGGLSAQAEAGNVCLLRGDWNDDFLQEISMFPNASHDDQVDAASRAFTELFGKSNTGMLEFMRGEFERIEREKEEAGRQKVNKFMINQ